MEAGMPRGGCRVGWADAVGGGGRVGGRVGGGQRTACGARGRGHGDEEYGKPMGRGRVCEGMEAKLREMGSAGASSRRGGRGWRDGAG